MYLTICPNTALDKIFFIDEWIPGTPMRTNRFARSAGGKGLNSAVVLRHLGMETTSIGFFAGSVGEELVEILEGYGINIYPVWVGGTTREAHVIADQKNNIHSHVIAGEMVVSKAHSKVFIAHFINLLDKAESIIFAGSIPESLGPGLYSELIPLAKAKGILTLVDAQKDVMKESIKAKPDIVKMNRDEFGWTFNKPVAALEKVIDEAIAFHDAHKLKNLVITMSEDGTLAVTHKGVFLSKAPRQKPVNAAGAGDAVSSSLAVKLQEGKSWEESLRFASAVGAAAVLTEGTGDVLMEDVNRIYPDVKVEKIS